MSNFKQYYFVLFLLVSGIPFGNKEKNTTNYEFCYNNLTNLQRSVHNRFMIVLIVHYYSQYHVIQTNNALYHNHLNILYTWDMAILNSSIFMLLSISDIIYIYNNILINNFKQVFH